MTLWVTSLRLFHTMHKIITTQIRFDVDLKSMGESLAAELVLIFIVGGYDRTRPNGPTHLVVIFDVYSCNLRSSRYSFFKACYSVHGRFWRQEMSNFLIYQEFSVLIVQMIIGIRSWSSSTAGGVTRTCTISFWFYLFFFFFFFFINFRIFCLFWLRARGGQSWSDWGLRRTPEQLKMRLQCYMERFLWWYLVFTKHVLDQWGLQ